jgi:hypothetical protein
MSSGRCLVRVPAVLISPKAAGGRVPWAAGLLCAGLDRILEQMLYARRLMNSSFCHHQMHCLLCDDDALRLGAGRPPSSSWTLPPFQAHRCMYSLELAVDSSFTHHHHTCLSAYR